MLINIQELGYFNSGLGLLDDVDRVCGSSSLGAKTFPAGAPLQPINPNLRMYEEGWTRLIALGAIVWANRKLGIRDLLNQKQNPLGSSSGCVIAVSAGLAPLAVSTETAGSLVTPSTRASLSTIKPNMGSFLQQMSFQQRTL